MHNKYPYKTRNFGQPVPRWQLRNKLGSEHTKCCIKSGEMMLYHFIYFDKIYGFFYNSDLHNFLQLCFINVYSPT